MKQHFPIKRSFAVLVFGLALFSLTGCGVERKAISTESPAEDVSTPLVIETNPPTATPSPTPVPEMIIDETTLTWPSPPGTWPTRARAKRKMRCVVPPVFIRLPARMKNGMARSVKPVVPKYIRCGSIARKLPCPRAVKERTAVKPIATTMGRSISRNRIRMEKI